ncbi:unnamed protein product [Vitrella brassicaformis CCMP3155]|uniref:DNA-directed DNA polymerase n=2 Tax=Vitrella brassicaformis TaxID=1169539 RepID=A0A0G4G2D7_VITBC|nr:unnamed protein product [Vitrella brassicaformis CCMP3155]|eukprot:CEM22347.1 unnamed protein product [Vitrella brassicaformis CCMP3155]
MDGAVTAAEVQRKATEARRKAYYKLKQRAQQDVHRRVARWRTVTRDGSRSIFYVTLGGDLHINKRDGNDAAREDSFYLRQYGIKDRQEGSCLPYPEWFEPYCSNRSDNPRDLSHWNIPEGLVEEYRRHSKIEQLYEWQAECLQVIWPATPGPCPPPGQVHMVQGEKRTRMKVVGSPTMADPPVWRNLVYCAPTAGGKSLVAEIIMLNQLVFQGRRCLMVLPYVALCREKARDLHSLWGDRLGLRVQAFHGGEGGGWNEGIDAAICTIEKANQIVTSLIRHRRLERAIGVLVVDELHSLSDSHRGYLLEVMLMKVQGYLGSLPPDSPPHLRTQVIGLSATLPNLDQICSWLDAEQYSSDRRPTPVDTFLKIEERIYQYNPSAAAQIGNSNLQPPPNPPAPKPQRPTTVTLNPAFRLFRTFSRPPPSLPLPVPPPPRQPNRPRGPPPPEMFCGLADDKEHVGLLVWESVRVKRPVLLFCHSKDMCQRMAQQLARTLPLYKSRDMSVLAPAEDADIANARHSLLQSLRRAASGVSARTQTPTAAGAADEAAYCPDMKAAIPHGVAYHHAGLTIDERRLIEEAYRAEVLSVLCATSTLAVGVNLPCARVILRSPRLGKDLLDVSRFRQMAGRAGRSGERGRGEAMIISDKKDAQHAQRLLTGEVERADSCLHGMRLAKALLEILLVRQAATKKDLVDYLAAHSLRAKQASIADIAKEVAPAVDYLFHMDLICANKPNPTIQRHHTYPSPSPSPAAAAAAAAAAMPALPPPPTHPSRPPAAASPFVRPAARPAARPVIRPPPPPAALTRPPMATPGSSGGAGGSGSGGQVAAPLPAGTGALQRMMNTIRREVGRLQDLRSPVMLSRLCTYGPMYSSGELNLAPATECCRKRLTEMLECAARDRPPPPSRSPAAPADTVAEGESQQSSVSVGSVSGKVAVRPVGAGPSGGGGAQVGGDGAVLLPGLPRVKDDHVLRLTPLGEAALQSHFHLGEACEQSADIIKVYLQGLNLRSDFQLLYLLTPLEPSIDIDWGVMGRLFEQEVDPDGPRKTISDHKRLAEFLGITKGMVHREGQRRPAIPSPHTLHEGLLAGKKSITCLKRDHLLMSLKRFYAALVLEQLLREKGQEDVRSRFGLSVSQLQAFQSQATIFQGQVGSLTENLGLSGLAAAMRQLGDRLLRTLEVPLELLPLCQIEDVQGRRARALADSGLDSVEKVAHADNTHIFMALGTVEGSEVAPNMEMMAQQARLKPIQPPDAPQTNSHTHHPTAQLQLLEGRTGREEAIRLHNIHMVRRDRLRMDTAQRIKRSALELVDQRTQELFDRMDGVPTEQAEPPPANLIDLDQDLHLLGSDDDLSDDDTDNDSPTAAPNNAQPAAAAAAAAAGQEPPHAPQADTGEPQAKRARVEGLSGIGGEGGLVLSRRCDEFDAQPQQLVRRRYRRHHVPPAAQREDRRQERLRRAIHIDSRAGGAGRQWSPQN